jgi:hypothetical protein
MSRTLTTSGSQWCPKKAAKIAMYEAKLASLEARGLYSSKAKPSKVMDEEEDEDEEELSEVDEDEEEELEEAKAKWNAAIDREMKHTRGDRVKATSRANRNNPGLRARLLRASKQVQKMHAAESRPRYR